MYSEVPLKNMARRYDTTARDVKRKLAQIRKYVEQLAELDMPVGVAYGSRKTGGLCVFGDQRITGVISKHAMEIIESKEWFSTTTGSTVPDTLSLPKLPKPWSKINAPTVKAILVGVVKDLGLPWEEDCRPEWWPEDVPFQHPRKGSSDVIRGMYTMLTICILKLLHTQIHKSYKSYIIL